MRKFEYTIGESFCDKQALSLLHYLGFSKRIIIRLKNKGGLFVNGLPFRTDGILKLGDKVEIILEDEVSRLPNGELNVKTAYDDEDVVVFDKPPFMPVHESLKHFDDTLANFFAAKYSGCTYRIINRLDGNTSGLCVVAKNILAASRLGASNGIMPQKTYLALVSGDISDDGEIIAPIAAQSNDELKHIVSEDGKFAYTKYHVVSHSERFTLLEVTLKTGRTHQIRVHFSYIGHPLLGDDLYGGDMTLINRHALHCNKISFIHPISREEITVESELPKDMAEVLKLL